MASSVGERQVDAVVDFGALALASGEQLSFRAGEVVFEAGATGTELYIVKSGTIGIRLGDNVVETVPEGGVFGEMALIDASPRSATAVAMTDATLVPVGERQFLFMVSEAPYFALSVMRVLARRLRQSNAIV
jgi:CRP/FNR family transcriptional regulator, cyclic AMP receptor protein